MSSGDDGLESKSDRRPDGAEIAYRFRPGRSPWVLLHGLGCDASMWDAVVEFLPSDLGLLIPELRGHGGSTLGWKVPSVDVWAEDVLAALAREEIDCPAIAGLSMGGYTALAVAAARPGFARGWALVSTSAAPDDEAGRARRAEGLATIRREGWKRFTKELIPNLLAEGHPDHSRNCEHLLKMFSRAGDAGLATALVALANRPDRRGILARIRAPVAVVVGDVDRLTPPECSLELAGAIPAARIEVLPGIAHMSALEAPREIAHLLASL